MLGMTKVLAKCEAWITRRFFVIHALLGLIKHFLTLPRQFYAKPAVCYKRVCELIYERESFSKPCFCNRSRVNLAQGLIGRSIEG